MNVTDLFVVPQEGRLGCPRKRLYTYVSSQGLHYRKKKRYHICMYFDSYGSQQWKIISLICVACWKLSRLQCLIGTFNQIHNQIQLSRYQIPHLFGSGSGFGVRVLVPRFSQMLDVRQEMDRCRCRCRWWLQRARAEQNRVDLETLDRCLLLCEKVEVFFCGIQSSMCNFSILI